MSKSVLLLFTKNPELGKCKTRLAATVGDQKALEIYKQLLDYTRDFSAKLALPKHIYYTWEITEKDRWSQPNFHKKLQAEGNLGAKMQTAFKESFKAGFEKVIIVGSDCAEINEKDVLKAEKLLDENQLVFGPALDGGYYLLGMNSMTNCVFEDKPWSQDHLLEVTLKELEEKNITYSLLAPKSDIDYEEDWKRDNYINGRLKE